MALSEPVINLCFHGVGAPQRELEDGEAEYWVTEGSLVGVLDLVVGREDVCLSFDDGNVSDIEVGLPALVERGLAAEFFVLAGRLDQAGSLTSVDVAALCRAGMRIGSHGMRHRPWRGTSGATLVEEFDTARARIEQAAGAPVTTAACPLGSYDRRTLAQLRRRGYERVMTSDRAHAVRGTWLQPRYSVRAQDDAASVARLLERRWTVSDRVLSSARIAAKSLR